MWEVGAVRLAESAAAAASWKLLNGNLSGNFTRPLSHGDTGALRKTKRRVSKSGSAQLTDGEDAQVGSGEQLFTCYRRSAPTNMPAIKKERLDGDDMALTAFNQSEYLAPLNATAIPVVTPHPPPYDHIFAHHRAYLGLHDSAALHHQHLHHHTDDLMLERFSSIPDFQPFFDNGEPCIEVECGENKALLYINKLCQGSKGPSIKYRGEWLTPNEFQFVSGRETAKDWKRSIRHKGKSLKTLMSKGILQVHPPICDCPGCRISSPVNRGRLAEKRTIPLPPNRVPKKELASIFSSDDSEGSDRASGDHAHIKQEDELHYSIMRKSRDSDLSTIISNLHHTRQHGMPEGQSASDHNTSTGHTDDLLGKRRSFSPNSSSECPSDSKKSRSVSPKENSQSPVVEAGGSHGHMSPEEHYRRMMSALSEQGSYEEQQQRLYQLASSMGLPGHDMLRARQEALAAAVRNPAALEAHLPSAGSSSSSSQRRKQGLPQHRDAHYTDRELSHPPPLLSPPTAPHIALGPHLRPPFLGMPSALCQAPGYGFLQPAQAEIFARQQEMLRKQNLARLEMSAELLRQKELESLHQRQQQQQQQQRLLGSDHLGALPHGLSPDHPALRSLHDIPEGHPLREELVRRSNAMLVLRHGAATPLLTLNHQQQQQQPGVPSTPKETQAQSSTAGQDADRKASRRGPQTQLRGGDHTGGREDRGREGDREVQDEEMKDSDSETEMCEERQDSVSAKSSSKPRERDGGKETGSKGVCDSAKETGENSGRLSAPCSSAGTESPSRHLFTPGLGKVDVKYHLPPGFIPPLPALHAQSLPFGFPYANPYFHTGSVGGLFMDGEDSASANPVEDISKWSVEDVCGFISSLAGCAEYTQVARRVGRLFYMTGFPLAFPFPPSAALRPPERDRDPLTTPSDTPLPLSLSLPHRPTSTSSSSSPYSGPTPGCSSPKQENGNGATVGGRYEAKTPS
ncbi:sterile alpha motif domain-containing protein 11 isoform X2 [Larimichthys crocea]|uniref:sterile alpha motif domain-containing protein 11 isoform X2 n=1 Tax=Larimichthys crocea TaxID=215358 RepID=UPI0009011873|nr:sterile alpha motif domain-containing protein 11 isoform X2 [Larimichthys crocea]